MSVNYPIHPSSIHPPILCLFICNIRLYEVCLFLISGVQVNKKHSWNERCLIKAVVITSHAADFPQLPAIKRQDRAITRGPHLTAHTNSEPHDAFMTLRGGFFFYTIYKSLINTCSVRPHAATQRFSGPRTATRPFQHQGQGLCREQSNGESIQTNQIDLALYWHFLFDLI